jgi:hypothetical protein
VLFYNVVKRIVGDFIILRLASLPVGLKKSSIGTGISVSQLEYDVEKNGHLTPSYFVRTSILTTLRAS